MTGSIPTTAATVPEEDCAFFDAADSLTGRPRSRRRRAAAFSPDGASAGLFATLLRTVETEVIPRLVMLHRTGGAPPPAAPGAPIDEDTVEAFTDVLLRGLAPAAEFVRGQGERGMPADVLCLQLLAPAARRLGEMWSADLCDFTEVTIGLSRLQTLLHQFCDEFWQAESCGRSAHSVMLLPAPGEQHTFGISMVAEFFRQAGWLVREDPRPDPDDVIGLVESEHFDVIGFSIANELHVQSLRALIERVRASSCNPAVAILAGGALVVSNPALAADLGVDATAIDAAQAMLRAQSLIAARDWYR